MTTETKIIKEHEDQGIDRIYSNYETIQAKVAYQWLPESSDAILEIGCSSGYFTKKLLGKANSVYGLDVNEEHINNAKVNYPEIHFIAVEADTLPYGDNIFDVVVMLEVYEHVADRAKIIHEVHRVLKPNGRLILSTPNTGLFAFLDSFNLKIRLMKIFPTFTHFLMNRVQRFKNTQYTDNLVWHGHYSLDSMKKTFKGQFEIEKAHRGGLVVFPLFAIVRSLLVRTVRSRTLFSIIIGIMNFDGAIPYGPCAYNLILQVRKI